MSDAPRTVAELAIVRSREQKISPQAALWAVAASVLVVPTTTTDATTTLTDFTPVFVGRADQQFLVVFTVPERVGRFSDTAPAFIEMLGADLLTRVAPGVGVVVNPETALGFELPANGVAAIRDELGTW